MLMDGFLVHAKRWETEAAEVGGDRADALRHCAAEVRAIVDYQREEAPAVVIVDGTAYPFDFASITAAQSVWMRRELGVSIPEMVTRLAVSLAELPEIVALMALSIEQTGGTVDLPDLIQQVTLSSVWDFAIDDSLIDVQPAPA